eukprot:7621029-Alexandrium_andersonii.AAC.1
MLPRPAHRQSAGLALLTAKVPEAEQERYKPNCGRGTEPTSRCSTWCTAVQPVPCRRRHAAAAAAATAVAAAAAAASAD